MVDWTASMQQTFEFYMVDPNTWRDSKKLTNIKKCSITRDSEVDTLGSATFDITESVGECYIRVYLITVQNGITEKHPLGTFLAQTPSSSFDGRIRNVTMDAYTPLLELKEKSPPMGYFIPKGTNIMQQAYSLIKDKKLMRGPISSNSEVSSTKLSYDFVSDINDTWLDFLRDLISAAVVDSGIVKYKFDLDELGRVLFVPDQDINALSPIWTYTDDNSSILYPDLNMEHDLYGLPNVVEVIYSNGDKNIESRIVNDDPNSPISTVNRGREIVYRDVTPNIHGEATQESVDRYAEDLLKTLSSIEYTVSYEHGYCPVRVGDCVRLNYTRAGLKNVKAKVISQNIMCATGCSVSEKAVFTNKLWR